MEIPLVGALAIIAYLGAAACLAASHHGRQSAGFGPKSLGIAFAVVAVIAHGILLYPSTVTGQGVNLGIFNAASLVAWCIAVLVLLLNLKTPIESLAVVILPVAATALALDLLYPGTPRLLAHLPYGLRLHIALSILAYSLFFIATIQAILLAVADRRLRQRQPIMDFLPPLPTMENVLFELTALAFLLLTVSLVFGGLYIENIHAQHLAHKIVFSILAWLVFAALILGHWRYGWRGRRGIKYVVVGFVLLALAFFGTKIVLELILRRV